MLLDSVENYLANGMGVFPLRGKVPLQGTRGVHDASWDVMNHGVSGPSFGVATGERSGVTVLDVDGAEGVASMKVLTGKHGREWTFVPTVKTPKGFHLYFHYKSGTSNRVRFLPGLDIRNDGGYVVGAGSVVGCDKYRWVRDLNFPLGRLPDFLFPDDVHNGPAYKDVDGFVAEGTRNQVLTSVCGHLLSRGVDEALTLRLLSAYNSTTVIPPLCDSEVRTIFNSVSRIEREKRGE